MRGKEMSQGGGNPAENANPIAVMNYLKGIHFPTHKKDLVDTALNQKAPEDVINTLKELEDKDYQTPADITKQIGKTNKSR